MVFSQLLARLDARLHPRRPACYATLEPPAPAAELAAFEAELGLTLPVELPAWWSWRSGQASSASLYGQSALTDAEAAGLKLPLPAGFP